MRRQDAIEIIKSECYVFNPLNFDRSIMINTALDMAVNALKIDEMYNLEYENGDEFISKSVLDKIRAEIEQTAKDYDKFDDYRRVRGLWIALEIIDKYKSESEGYDADGV